MIFTFPYHDPEGTLFPILESKLDSLGRIFSALCISATPQTVQEQPELLRSLERRGCTVLRNQEGTMVGDHYRGALGLALSQDDTHIYFGFIDRTLFALAKYTETFLLDMEAFQGDVPVLFDRTEKAWKTHPKNYREIEVAINVLAKYYFKREVECLNCGMIIPHNIAKQVLPQSQASGFSAGLEWMLLFELLGYGSLSQKVDWLSWEDPYIEHSEASLLKQEREESPKEHWKRIKANGPCIELLLDKRFRGLLCLEKRR